MGEPIWETTTDDGNFRARVMYDECPSMPDGDYFGTVYNMESHYYKTIVTMLGTSYKRYGAGLEDTITHLWAALKDMEQVTDCLMGRASVCAECDEFIVRTMDDMEKWTTKTITPTYGRDGVVGTTVCATDYSDDQVHWSSTEDVEDGHIVGVDYFDRSDGTKLIAIVTLDDLNMWGFASLAEWKEKFPSTPNPASGNLKEWVAWSDNEVYEYVVERRLVSTIEDRTPSGELVSTRNVETWDHLESCGGYYDEDTAREDALAELNARVHSPAPLLNGDNS